MKHVVFVADSLDNAHKFREVLSCLDVTVSASSTAQYRRVLAGHSSVDLVIYEAKLSEIDEVAQLEQAVSENGSAPILVIVDQSMLSSMRLPVQLKSDFVVSDASRDECSIRIKQLLWPGTESTTSDIISVDGMTVNLATYQVQVNGCPIDFTYLEYALLAFLITHPDRAYSRDALLRRVWGFEYYGGSRTVDVHVRRVRAKLGPELAQRLETVRGVGYMWAG